MRAIGKRGMYRNGVAAALRRLCGIRRERGAALLLPWRAALRTARHGGARSLAHPRLATALALAPRVSPAIRHGAASNARRRRHRRISGALAAPGASNAA